MDTHRLPLLGCLLLLLALAPFRSSLYAEDAPATAAPPVLLREGDFATMPADAKLPAWLLTRGSLQTVDGKTALVLDGSYASARQTVLLDPAWTHVELSATLRPQAVVRGDADWKTARIALTFKGADGERVGAWPAVYEATGSADWAVFRRVYAVPAGAVALDVVPANFGASGRLELRQIAVRPATDKLTPGGPRPVIVLKLDDLAGVTPRWQALLDFLVAEEVPAGIGIIGSSLEQADPALVAWIAAAREKHGIEFWNHGYKNRTAADKQGEFEGASMEAQFASLQRTQALAQETLGQTFAAFGPHWSGTNEATVAALGQIPDLRVVFYYTGQGHEWFTYERFVDLEKPIFKPNAAFVEEQFSKWAHRKPYLCLQGHPNSWDTAALEQFKATVRYLKAQGCEFATPSGYVRAHHPEVFTRERTATAAVGLAADPAWFPFVIPGDDALPNATDFSGGVTAAAGADGFVRVQDGHFHTDAGRVRFWGMNTCFAANFPTHAEADAVAPHLRKLGLNAMRIHHMDGTETPNGILRTAADGSRSEDPEQVDRLDYFMAKMIENGVYLNLNLHVNRAYTEFADFDAKALPSEFRYTKFLLYFDPRMRQGFKAACRDYLLHVNPYRGLRRVDDPAVAMVEITNENSLAREPLATVDLMPETFRAEWDRQWRAWLATRYADTAALRQAWAPLPAEALGAVVMDGADFGREAGAWLLNVTEGEAEALWDQPAAGPERRALKVDIRKPARLRFKQELQRPGVSLREGQVYTLRFQVRADKPCEVYLDLSNGGPTDWSSLGFGENLKLTKEWQTITRTFSANRSVDGTGRVCMKMGGEDTAIYLADFHLQEGADLTGLPADESLEAGNIAFPIRARTNAAIADARSFMASLEHGFMTDMTAYLREDLGVRVPITGSQMSYHAAGVIEATADYADMHAYWQHPNFPGRPWDTQNWLIEQKPVETIPGRDPLSRAARWRLLDRPFTVSEWNIANPQDSGASTVPFAAIIAALQDWDAVFFFDYNAKADGWMREGPEGFFSFSGQPAKLALLGVGGHLFRRGDLQAIGRVQAAATAEDGQATAVLSHRLGIGAVDDAGEGARSEEAAPAEPTTLATPSGSVRWSAEDPAAARIVVDTPATKGVTGLLSNSTVALPGMTLEVGAVDRDYAAIFLTSRDGQPIAAGGPLLLNAVGRVERSAMGWNADRTSVRWDWGIGPGRVNGIPLTLTLPATTVLEAYALDARGERTKAIPVQHADGAARLELGPGYGTLWYEIVTAQVKAQGE